MAVMMDEERLDMGFSCTKKYEGIRPKMGDSIKYIAVRVNSKNPLMKYSIVFVYIWLC